MAAVLGLVLELVGVSARQMAGRVARATVLMAVALVCAAIGLGGLAGALWIVLAHRLDPVSAALILGGLGLGLACGFGLIARAQLRGRRQAVALKEVVAAVAALMQEDGAGVWTPVLTAALVGFLITGRR